MKRTLLLCDETFTCSTHAQALVTVVVSLSSFGVDFEGGLYVTTGTDRSGGQTAFVGLQVSIRVVLAAHRVLFVGSSQSHPLHLRRRVRQRFTSRLSSTAFVLILARAGRGLCG